AVTLPAALLGVVVAARRGELFRPAWSMPRMAGLQLVVGGLYAGGCVALGRVAALALLPAVPSAREWLDAPVSLHFVSYLFLYIILAGFLVWIESIARVQESRAEAAREAMLRAQAEARALRAQFNPHFVFNVLHSLMLLVREDPGAAERAIEDVAALIRYASTLQREERDTVALEEEIAFARRYLALEKLRLEKRLRIEWEVEGELGPVAVPAFALQTLLENAVRHGVAPRPEGATVRVSAVREGERVVLAVEDDGEGAPPAAVGDSPGRGLALLRDRLERLYGGDGSLEWETVPGEGFGVRLTVPWEATDAGPVEPRPAAATAT
nr:hypothetical protein [Gemmatimonadota bacterium]NIR80653.1 hypothetical protein [Gemmatimonadota bacterium]NIT89440.1 hypothetical protein [Gemmatimonadota bacterium]NIU33247.1 hypothetical protein [Gemmatimonadota bacterium]NIU37560.1 hypothetical protein [Gemmatimonadota bacterium]